MAIRWDKLTLKSQEAVQKASELAAENGNAKLLPIHLLAALLEDKEGIVAPVLRRIGTSPEKLLNDAAADIERLPKVPGVAAHPGLSRGFQKVMEQDFKQADAFKD